MKLTVHSPVISGNTIRVRYSDSTREFTHEFIAAAELPADPAAIKLVEWLAISHSTYVFSFEYYDELETEFSLSDKEIQFFEQVFYDGMAEFRFVNNIPIATRTIIKPALAGPARSDTSSIVTEGALLLNGGGKDGLTAGLLLKEAGLNFTLFQIGTGAAQRQTQAALESDVVLFKRLMDPLRNEGRYQGHRPTSASIAIAAALTALITGKKDVIASNENSANEPNLEVDGVSINHQFTKTYAFEKQFSDLLALQDIPVRYFSIMRPYHELQIAKLLTYYPEHSSQFISCNHGFRKGYWCGVCAKCAFIILMFTALEPAIVKRLFGSTDSINTPRIAKHIDDLIHPGLVKPLECVGTLEESQIAAYMILKNTPELLSAELSKSFETATSHITDDRIAIFFAAFNPVHAIPADYEQVLVTARTKLQR